MAPAAPRMIFVNIAVRDLPRSRSFFEQIGFSFDLRFTNDEAACLVLDEGHNYVMLLTREKFGGFTRKEIVDSTRSIEAILAISAESRAAVDELVDAALAAGGSPTGETVDYGFMYYRSFLDPDGHTWEVLWMDESAVPPEPGA